LMQLTVQQKQAGTPTGTQPGYTQDELITEAAKLATADAATQVKTALLHVVDDAIYAAEAAALEVKKAESEPAPSPIKIPNLPKKAALEELPATPPAANIGGEQAMAAMSDPVPPDGEGGAPSISEEEAQALMAQSLQENGVDPAALTGDELGAEPALEEGTEFSPEELDALVAAMQQAGISPEEVDAAIMELQQEDGAGITPEQGMLADEEAAKTGHYKFASFVKRPAAKTAQQEQRAAMIRGAVRDFAYGPNPKNFQ
ncbi:MAG: hypothetical protein FWD31_11300, partial [Planctomycetaceae bacterium]|nr:hypothetical protein [Planctomycetaceae bacterium]